MESAEVKLNDGRDAVHGDRKFRSSLTTAMRPKGPVGGTGICKENKQTTQSPFGSAATCSTIQCAIEALPESSLS